MELEAWKLILGTALWVGAVFYFLRTCRKETK